MRADYPRRLRALSRTRQSSKGLLEDRGRVRGNEQHRARRASDGEPPWCPREDTEWALLHAGPARALEALAQRLPELRFVGGGVPRRSPHEERTAADVPAPVVVASPAGGRGPVGADQGSCQQLAEHA